MKLKPGLGLFLLVGFGCAVFFRLNWVLAQQVESQPTTVSTQENGSINKPRWVERSIETNQGPRWYRVLRPKSYRPGNPAVVLLHGGTQSMRKIFARNNDATAHWQTIALREGFLLIVPNGSSKNGDPNGDRQNWNDLRKKDVAKPSINDVEFIETLISSLQKNYEFDSKRVYVTGASNGGMMTFRMLIEKPDLFAAGAAFIASLPEDYSEIERPKTTTPLLMCNGTSDPLVKWEGGEVGRNRGRVSPIEETVKWWVDTNRCKTKPQTVPKLDDKDPNDGCRAVRHVYAPKKGGSAFEFVKIEGGGHTLPSLQYSLPKNRLIERLIGTMCHDIEGAEMAWGFMKLHHR